MIALRIDAAEQADAGDRYLAALLVAAEKAACGAIDLDGNVQVYPNELTIKLSTLKHSP